MANLQDTDLVKTMNLCVLFAWLGSNSRAANQFSSDSILSQFDSVPVVDSLVGQWGGSLLIDDYVQYRIMF